jgi:hypothetical protein
VAPALTARARRHAGPDANSSPLLLAASALTFLDEPSSKAPYNGAWPRLLESPSGLTFRRWCPPTDETAATFPLYALDGDTNRVVAQVGSARGFVGVAIRHCFPSAPEPGQGLWMAMRVGVATARGPPAC